MVVIPCSGTKLDRPAPAGQLYTGSWYRLARQAADQLVAEHGGSTLILSAMYGLLSPGTFVEPYDLRMTDPGSVTDYLLTAQVLGLVDDQLRADLRAFDPEGTTPLAPPPVIVSLLPAAYRDRLAAGVRRLPPSMRPRMVDALHGCAGVGYQRQRLAWLRDHPAQLDLDGAPQLVAGRG